jgi:mRNA interferase MazF
MPPLQWTVVEADLDPVRGSEQRGRRPVLVVSEEAFNQAMPSVTVLPLTATDRSLYPSEVMLPAHAAGQPRDSIVMAHQIRTISKKRLGRVYGQVVDGSLREAIRTALTEHLDPDES